MLKHWINFKPETEQIKTLRTRQGKLALDIHQSLTKTEVKTWLEGTFPIKITGQNICNPKKNKNVEGKI
jgi:ribosomal protein L23